MRSSGVASGAAARLASKVTSISLNTKCLPCTRVLVAFAICNGGLDSCVMLLAEAARQPVSFCRAVQPSGCGETLRMISVVRDGLPYMTQDLREPWMATTLLPNITTRITLVQSPHLALFAVRLAVPSTLRGEASCSSESSRWHRHERLQGCLLRFCTPRCVHLQRRSRTAGEFSMRPLHNP